MGDEQLNGWNEAWRSLGHAIRKGLQEIPLAGDFFRWYFGLLRRIGHRNPESETDAK